MLRLLIVLLVLSGLVAFALQNMIPTLPIVFLGLQTPPLPLALWILIALTAGALTTIAISSLLGLSRYFARETGRRSVKADSRRSSFRTSASNFQDRSQERRSTQSKTQSSPRSQTPEDQEFFGDDDEDFLEDDFRDEEADPPPNRRTVTNSAPKATPEPSTYSYSAGSSVTTGAGRKEAVYDAEYKVIIPPYRVTEEPFSPPPNQPAQSPPQTEPQPDSWNDWDDWDREFEDDEERDRKR
ncbi:MAG: hypothetical protein SFW36_08560 [Leptolyngbyaceae cyanobacterium bins.59]|nr:hypothetical protein [Leptolyngbyaceae cyanobacterium bins.59]